MYGRIACFMVRIRAGIIFLMTITKSMNLISVHFLTYLKRLLVSSLVVFSVYCFSRHKNTGCSTTRISHFTLAYIEGWTYGRMYIRTYGRTVARSRDNQNYSHRRVTTFSYQWCSARAELRYRGILNRYSDKDCGKIIFSIT